MKKIDQKKAQSLKEEMIEYTWQYLTKHCYKCTPEMKRLCHCIELHRSRAGIKERHCDKLQRARAAKFKGRMKQLMGEVMK